MSGRAENHPVRQPLAATIRMFLGGDVMTGRGIDQVLAYPCSPLLHEGYVRSAMDYVHLAEDANGPIPRHAGPAYVWGVGLNELDRMRPDIRIVNLETSITRSDDYEPKGINYRMSPENADCLTAARIDCCTLANNHVLDWGRAGLVDTLGTLQRLHIKTAGAGSTLREAGAPAALDTGRKGRVLVFSAATETSGTPADWAATDSSPGVNWLPALTETNIARFCDQIARARKPDDIVVVAVHWGPNWGYGIATSHQRLAHALVEDAGVSIVFGHSSHHAKAIEVHRDRLILYGCGDLLNDYEGIAGYEEYRGDLAAMYFADIDVSSGDLIALTLAPFQHRRFQLTRPTTQDARWLAKTLDRESRHFGARVDLTSDNHLVLRWQDANRRVQVPF